MKNAIIFILLFWSGAANAQNYFPFPESNSKWRFHCGAGFMGESQWCLNYFINENDTFINTIKYNRLFESGYYMGSYRNDTVNKKVFFVPPSDTAEIIWYDFSLSVGDTFIANQNIFDVCFSSKKILTDIDTVLIKNQYRKRYSFIDSSGWLPNYVIEGIGSSGGLFRFYDVCLETGCGMVYFNENNDTLLFTLGSSCNGFNNIINVNPATSVKIFPNPASGYFYIENNFVLPFLIKIYNSEGKLTYHQSENPDSTIEVITKTWAKGIYFVNLISEGKVLVKEKLIIQ